MMKRTHRALTEVGFPTSSMDGFLEWNHEWNSLLFACSCIRAGCLYALYRLGVCHILLYICASIVSFTVSFQPRRDRPLKSHPIRTPFRGRSSSHLSNNRSIHRTNYNSFRTHSSPNPFVFKIHKNIIRDEESVFSQTCTTPTGRKYSVYSFREIESRIQATRESSSSQILSIAAITKSPSLNENCESIESETGNFVQKFATRGRATSRRECNPRMTEAGQKGRKKRKKSARARLLTGATRTRSEGVCISVIEVEARVGLMLGLAPATPVKRHPHQPLRATLARHAPPTLGQRLFNPRTSLRGYSRDSLLRR